MTATAMPRQRSQKPPAPSPAQPQPRPDTNQASVSKSSALQLLRPQLGFEQLREDETEKPTLVRLRAPWTTFMGAVVGVLSNGLRLWGLVWQNKSQKCMK